MGVRVGLHATYIHPPHSALEAFVGDWSDEMRERGGDPDLGHQVPALLSAAGFEVMAANATLECTSANDFQWSAGAPVILLSAAKRGAAHTDGERQARVLRDLDALRTEGWLYFGI